MRVGRRNAAYVEILDGLRAGEVYVAQGSFLVKAQLSKGSFDDGHNH